MNALLKMYYYSTNTNKKVPQNATSQFLSAELYNIINRDIDNIYNVIKDETFDTKLMIYECLEAGIMERPNRYDYQIVGREEVFNLTDMVHFISAKKNSDVKLQLEAKLQESK
jgi:hypothetical protein